MTSFSQFRLMGEVKKCELLAPLAPFEEGMKKRQTPNAK